MGWSEFTNTHDKRENSDGIINCLTTTSHAFQTHNTKRMELCIDKIK